ncbi:MAG: preprotein translocase subunit YajC, partial [Gemmatimonadota bacterium]
FMWIAIIAIFYFLLIRPQRKAQKQHQEMLQALQRGDRVMTDGGVIGEIIHLRESEVTIKTDGDTRLVIARPKIARVYGREAEG